MEYIRVTSDNIESFNDRIIDIKRSLDSVKADVESANLDDVVLLEKSKDLSSNMALIRPQTIPQGSFLYRLRKVEKLEEIKNIDDITEFSYNHSKKKEEIVRNRLNLSGSPIFYSSIIPSTCFKELGNVPIVGYPYFFLSCWQVSDDNGIKVFPLLKSQIDVLKNTPQYHLLYTYFKDFYESMLEHYREDDKKYLLSAIYAHAIYDFKLEEKNLYEGIAYPSVKNTNTEEYNLALTTSCVDKKLQLNYVLRGFNDVDCFFKYDKVGINQSSRIQWYKIPDVRELDKVEKFDLYLNDKNKCDVDSIVFRHRNGVIVSLCDLYKFSDGFDYQSSFVHYEEVDSNSIQLFFRNVQCSVLLNDLTVLDQNNNPITDCKLHLTISLKSICKREKQS